MSVGDDNQLSENVLKLRYLLHRTNLALAHKVSKVHYEPLGVVCAIVSWNYRVSLALSLSL